MGVADPGQAAEAIRFVRFGPFRLDRQDRLLFRDDEPIPLPPKAADLLFVLLEEPGALCSKEELIARVWPDVIVDESNLTQNVFLLRKALGDEGGRWIVTVPRRGYRFAGEVTSDSSRPVISDAPSPVLAVTRRWKHFAKIVAIVLAIAAGLAVVMIVSSRALNNRHAPSEPFHSIAVLPFQPVDGKQSDRILDLGMADSLINKLSQLSEIAISPTHAILPYLDGHADALSAGRELGVDGVVEGNIQRVGRRIRCTVRLLRVANGTALWADRYDEDAADLFDLEDRIAERVATALDIHLDSRERRGLSKRYTNDRQAYDLYLQGRLAWEQFDREGLEASIRYYNAALQRDPRYALAYAGLAKTYSVMYIYGPVDPQEAAVRTREMASRALALDGQIAEAHVPMAATGVFQDWNWTLAEEEVNRALELDPSSDAHTLRGYILQARGKPEEALYEMRREREIDPLWAIPKSDWVFSLYLCRRYDQTIADGLQLLALQPHNRMIRYCVGRAMLQKGLVADAVAQQAANVSQYPDYPYSIGELAVIDARRGNRADFLKRIAQIESLRAGDRGRRVDYALGVVYAELNDADAAFHALDAAYRLHFPFLWHVTTDPSFDSIRSDPRYRQLLARLNLASPQMGH